MNKYSFASRAFGCAIALVSSAFLFSSTVFAATSPIGATPGSFAVSPTGAATYTIPIAVPPGTAGMEPKLALSYNSQGGNGLLGMGWSLSGLSAITRCPTTVAQDGVKGGVNFDANDRVCLDGQRLVAIAGAYGADGTEYRTEIESFSRIISYGTAGSGPAWFKVWTKSGQIIEFANTADSRIEAQGKSSVMVWAVNKISDTVGNYLTVTYTEDNANGQYYPSRVDYTGNLNTGTATYNSVQFTPVTRTADITPLYQAGSMIKNTVLLSDVKTFAGTTLVRDYVLKYDPSASTTRPRLTSLTECEGNGMGGTGVCLPPTTLAWQEGSAGFDAAIVGSTDIINKAVFPLDIADVNGDGKADLVWYSWNDPFANRNFALSNGNGFDASVKATGYQKLYPGRQPLTVDINGDGLTDYAWAFPFPGDHIAFTLSHGDAYINPYDTGVAVQSAYPFYLQPGDINGDGKGDLLWLNGDSGASGNSTGYLYFSLTSGNNYYAAVNTNLYFSARPLIADVNGDGRADIVWLNNGNIYYALSNGNGFDSPVNSGVAANPNADGPWVADVNGDGKADLVWLDNASGINFSLSTGAGFGAAVATGITVTSSAGPWVADVNGDGRSDMIWLTASGGGNQINYSLSTGNGFGAALNSSVNVNFSSISDIRVADVNGDGKADLVWPNGSSLYISKSSGTLPDLLTSVKTGLGVMTTLAYKPLTDNSIYTKGSGSPYPILDLQAPIYAVSSASSSNGVGGSFNTAYTYGGAKADLQGRGFLGFAWVQSVDNGTGITSRTEYHQDYPYTGMPASTTRTYADITLSYIGHGYNAKAFGATRYFPYSSSTIEVGNDLNGASLPVVVTSRWYDDFGNPTSIRVSSENYVKTTNNTYTNDTANWFLGRLTRATVTSTKPDNTSLTRTSSFAYNATNGLLTQEVIEPDNVALKLVTDYGYDAFGNKKRVTVSGVDIVTRASTTTYDAKGQFPTSSANALGHTETRVFDARFGTVASLTGPNGLTTTWQYDGFGRKVLETRADSTQTSWAYDWDSVCINGGYTITTSASGAPPVGVCYDMLNRETRTFTIGFSGLPVTKDTAYDSLGRVAKVSRPYTGGTGKWTIYAYDEPLARIHSVTEPDASKTTTIYDGLTTTITDANNHNTIRVKNSQGQLIQVIDAKGGITSYTYDPFGNLIQTTDAKNNITTLTYDIRGRKISMADPDMGSWSYQYNVLGELIKQTDANLRVTKITYDKLGRIKNRGEPDLISTWTYDTATKGIGKLAGVVSDNGASRSYTYDSLGRTSSVVSVIDAAYTVSTTYDAYGRVATYSYPTGFTVKNVYNNGGHLSEVRNNATNALYWQATAKDAEGHVLNETLGNGVTTARQYMPETGRLEGVTTNNGAIEVQSTYHYYDPTGNLTGRWNNVGYYWDTFDYDSLNRLTGYLTSNPLVIKPGTYYAQYTYDYDSIGNITYKSDLGFYTYNTNGVRPHAVANVTGPAATLNYTYDANGNLLTGAGRTVTWNSFNMVSQVTQGANTLTYNYDADHTRIKETGPDGTTIYLNPRLDQGGHFEKITKTDGTIEYKHYLYAGGQSIGVYTSRSTGQNDTRYFHTDHLGSISVITNESGAVVSRFAYDPFGNRTVLAGTDAVTHHGFTGHEHMEEVGLVNMNGRIYDPALARFMSADPNIQAPGNGQSFNRYSYVFNNPLSYTDPSGYLSLFGHKILPGVFNNRNARVVAAIAVAVYAPQYIGNFGAGFASGLVGSGGDLKAGLIGGLTAGAFGGLHGMEYGWDKVLAHGVVGGLSSVASGGSFGSGFLAAGFTQAASWSGAFNGIEGRLGNAVAAAVVGGTASVIGGGKFENGAVMGAFSRLFNDLAINYYDDKSVNPYGHVGGNVVGEPSMGLYAKNDIDALLGNKTSGEVRYDQTEGGHGEPYKTVIIKTTPEQDQKFRTYLMSNRGYSKLMYDLNADSARNCATFIETGLHYAGVYAPSYIQPRMLIDDLAKQNGTK